MIDVFFKLKSSQKTTSTSHIYNTNENMRHRCFELKKTLSCLIPLNERLSSQNRNKPKMKTNASENQRDQCFKP